MNYSTSRALLLSVAVCLLCAATGFADVEFRNGSLIYKLDDRGNRVPDFSHAGYRAGETAIPELAAKVVVAHPASDNTEVIQAAIDQVSRLPADANGFRGAVLIPPGQYPVYGTLRIRASGVGLRGSGAGKGGTTLIAAGNDRRTLVEISGSPFAILGDPLPVADDYLPVNTTRVRLRSAHGLVSGDMVRISHACTKQWISALNMADFCGDRHGPSWRPGSRDTHWIRQITHVEGDSITLDAPLTLAFDAARGQASLVKIKANFLGFRHF